MRVKLRNVGVINSCDVEFIPGINLIIGSSGSGKSTLMRSIYNMASNTFSDSDISFGKNTMNIAIDCDDNHVEYTRSIKANGEKFYYKVNGETYTKVGRTALPQVSDTLKVGDLEVNGESINFNFNLQFSTPFLILGSQSTLYNVLTDRSSFDISSINDYYKADIKNNDSEITTNETLKERMSASLEDLKRQADTLSPIEQIYSDYIVCKHKSEMIDELTLALEKIKQINKITNLLEDYRSAINNTDVAINTISKLSELNKFKQMHESHKSVKSKISKYSKLVSQHENAINTVQKLIDFNKVANLIKNESIISNTVLELTHSTDSCKSLLSKEQLFIDVIKQKSLMTKLDKCSSAVRVIGDAGNGIITVLDDLMVAKDKIDSLNNVNNCLVKVTSKDDAIHKQLSEFSVCPLCGGSLHNAKKEKEKRTRTNTRRTKTEDC